MSEPTAQHTPQDWETASILWSLDTVDAIADGLAAERARVLDLTPEAAGRLFDDACVIAETNRSDDARSWARAGGLAFLAALQARAEGA